MTDEFSPVAKPGILHTYSPGLCAFEYSSSTNTKLKPHTLLFIGGLHDGLGTVKYIHDIAAALEPGDWSVFSVLLSSSYSGYGTSSLDKDVDEIAQCVKYVKAYKARQAQDEGASNDTGMFTIMGHSTGSQDVLHYIYSQPQEQQSEVAGGAQAITRPPVDGAILQAPVSDREALLSTLETGTLIDSPEVVDEVFYDLVDQAKSNNSTDFLLPLAMTSRVGYSVPMSSRRFLSLTSPDSPEHPLEDDLFSSDLDDKRLQQTFGKIGSSGFLKKSILVIPGGSDEYLPEWVEMDKLINRWEKATKEGQGGQSVWDENSGVIPGARHALTGRWQEKPIQDMVSRVQKFLNNLEKA